MKGIENLILFRDASRQFYFQIFCTDIMIFNYRKQKIGNIIRDNRFKMIDCEQTTLRKKEQVETTLVDDQGTEIYFRVNILDCTCNKTGKRMLNRYPGKMILKCFNQGNWNCKNQVCRNFGNVIVSCFACFIAAVKQVYQCVLIFIIVKF